VAELEFAYWLAQTDEATRTLAASGELTPEGECFVAGMRGTVRMWAEEPVSPAIRSTVDDLLVASAIGWRLRNLCPRPDGIALLSRLWQAGRCPSTIDILDLRPAADPTPARLLGIARSLWQRAAGEPVEEQDVAVRAYLDGEWDVAAKEFQAAVWATPSDMDGWVGLCLAGNRAGAGGPVAQVLATRPELFVALYRELRATGPGPDLGDLAEWLTKGATSAAARYRS
jgi:hypothetical protein